MTKAQNKSKKYVNVPDSNALKGVLMNTIASLWGLWLMGFVASAVIFGWLMRTDHLRYLQRLQDAIEGSRWDDTLGIITAVGTLLFGALLTISLATLLYNGVMGWLS